jgi:hypothetical protein
MSTIAFACLSMLLAKSNCIRYFNKLSAKKSHQIINVTFFDAPINKEQNREIICKRLRKYRRGSEYITMTKSAGNN